MPAAQSVFDVHVVAHLLVAESQLNGAQIVAGPALHRPSPSHTSMSLTAAPSQVPGLHTVPAGCLRQCPCPSHVPSRPQVDAGVAAQADRSSGTPFATKEQMPGALAALQVLHVSVQALLQQTPSTQKPLWQSPAQPHAWPFAFRALASAVAQDASPASGFEPPLSPPQPPPHPVAPRSSAQSAIPERRVTPRPYPGSLVIEKDDLDAVVLGAAGRGLVVEARVVARPGRWPSGARVSTPFDASAE